MVLTPLGKRPKTKFIGKQNENKKVHRSRQIGPSHKLQQTDRRLVTNYPTSIIIGSIKTARTNHINLVSRTFGGVLQYRRAHQGYWYGQTLREGSRWPGTGLTGLAGTNKTVFMVRTGTTLFNVPFGFRSQALLARAAGTFCKVLWHQPSVWLTVFRAPSKKLLKMSMSTTVTLGRNANKFFNKLTWGCAKKTVKHYKKVKGVRGVAMNPVDHPNGGRANTKQPLKNPWGFIAKNNK
jgi:large subunit ribosomal protein L2